MIADTKGKGNGGKEQPGKGGGKGKDAKNRGRSAERGGKGKDPKGARDRTPSRPPKGGGKGSDRNPNRTICHFGKMCKGGKDGKPCTHEHPGVCWSYYNTGKCDVANCRFLHTTDAEKAYGPGAERKFPVGQGPRPAKVTGAGGYATFSGGKKPPGKP